MSGNYPDGFNQSMFDRYTEEREFYDQQEDTPKVQHSTEWLSEVLKEPLLEITKQTEGLNADLEKVAEQVIKTCEAMNNLEKLKNDLTAALRECLTDYCVGCGSGEQGTSEFHHQDCRMFLLLQKAEGRRLKQNMEPEEEE